jgi:hypothetical protein
LIRQNHNDGLRCVPHRSRGTGNGRAKPALMTIIHEQKSGERTARLGNCLPIMTDDEQCSIAEYVRRDFKRTPGERHTVEFSQLFA